MSPDAAVATDTATGPFCPPRAPPGPPAGATCLCWLNLTSAINNNKTMAATSNATQWRRMNARGPRADEGASRPIGSFNTTSHFTTVGPTSGGRCHRMFGRFSDYNQILRRTTTQVTLLGASAAPMVHRWAQKYANRGLQTASTRTILGPQYRMGGRSVTRKH